MFRRSISWPICVFVVVAAVHNDSRSITGSDPEVTVHHLTTENLEYRSRILPSAEPTTTTATTSHPTARADGAAVSLLRMTTMAAVKQVKEAAVTELGALLDAGAGAIVTLAAGDTELAVHRAVLADRSPVFAAMFSHGMAEDSTGRVPIRDVEGPVLRQLVAYLYSRQAPQLSSTTPQLLAAAHEYGVTELKAQCEQLLAAHLAVENAAAAAVVAVRYSCSSLRPAAVAFIKAHTHEVMATQGWAEAVLRQPKHLIEVSRLLYDLPAGRRAPAATGSSTAASTAASSIASTTDSATVTASTTASTVVSTTTSTSTTTAASTTASNTASTVALTPTSTTASTIVTTATSITASTTASSTASTAAPHQPHSTQPTPPLDEAAVSRLRSLSTKEKGRRLIEAAKQGEVTELRKLLAAGADVRARDGDNRTALHYVAWQGDVPAARCLLEAGAEVGAKDSWQRNTPLHWAAYYGHAAVVRLLLSWGADVNARDKGGDTPLHDAASKGDAEAAAVLLEAGADRAATNNRGQTPLDIATERNRQWLIQMLS